MQTLYSDILGKEKNVFDCILHEKVENKPNVIFLMNPSHKNIFIQNWIVPQKQKVGSEILNRLMQIDANWCSLSIAALGKVSVGVDNLNV